MSQISFVIFSFVINGARFVCFVQVNGNSLVNANHLRAVAVLKEAGNDVSMVVTRLVPTQKVGGSHSDLLKEST